MEKLIWTSHDIEIIKDYYNKFGIDSPSKIYDILKKGNIKKIRARQNYEIKKGRLKRHKNDKAKKGWGYLTERQKKFIKDNINVMRVTDIANILNISKPTVSKYKSIYIKELIKNYKIDSFYGVFRDKMKRLNYDSFTLKKLYDYEIIFIMNELNISYEKYLEYSRMYIKEGRFLY